MISIKQVLVVGVALVCSFAGEALAAESSDVIATFEGTSINLAEGWDEATACIVDEEGARCYRTRDDLERAEDDTANGLDDVTLMASCASSLTLYSGTSYSGSSLSLSTRSTFISLSSYGFNNVTSSYTVGACSANFYDGSLSSGPYPGNTLSAGSSAASMVSGWDNRISTVYIN